MSGSPVDDRGVDRAVEWLYLAGEDVVAALSAADGPDRRASVDRRYGQAFVGGRGLVAVGLLPFEVFSRWRDDLMVALALRGHGDVVIPPWWSAAPQAPSSPPRWSGRPRRTALVEVPSPIGPGPVRGWYLEWEDRVVVVLLGPSDRAGGNPAPVPVSLNTLGGDASPPTTFGFDHERGWVRMVSDPDQLPQDRLVVEVAGQPVECPLTDDPPLEATEGAPTVDPVVAHVQWLATRYAFGWPYAVTPDVAGRQVGALAMAFDHAGALDDHRRRIVTASVALVGRGEIPAGWPAPPRRGIPARTGRASLSLGMGPAGGEWQAFGLEAGAEGWILRGLAGPTRHTVDEWWAVDDLGALYFGDPGLSLAAGYADVRFKPGIQATATAVRIHRGVGPRARWAEVDVSALGADG